MRRFSIFSLIAAIVICIASCGPSSEIPNKYVGTWGYNQGQLLGLYEEFVIYNNGFWEYQNVEKSSDALSITIGKDAQVVTLKVDYKDENAISLSADNLPKTDCMRMGSMLEDRRNAAKREDVALKPAKDEIDSATVIFYTRFNGKGIERYFRNLSYSKSHRFYYRWYYDFAELQVKPVDSTENFGYRFEFKVPVQGVTEMPTSPFFNMYGYSTSSIQAEFLLQPGDTLVAIYDDASKDFWYSGTTVSYIDDLVAYDKYRHFRGSIAAFICDRTLRDLREFMDLKDSSKIAELASAKTSDLQNFNKGMAEIGCKPNSILAKYGNDKINYLTASNYIYLQCSDNVVEDYFRDSVRFNEDELYCNSGIWECSSSWVNYNCKKRMSNYGKLDFTKVDFLKELGFSDTFINRWKVLKAVQYVKSFNADRWVEREAGSGISFLETDPQLVEKLNNDIKTIRESFDDPKYVDIFNQISARYIKK